jgi:signal transduction histidine kinase
MAVNACEAMPDGGTLRIRTTQDEPGTLKISFLDEGPGIDEEATDRLFEPFFTTKDGGTGLGLAIAHRIIHAHGGTIKFRNRTQGGAEFEIVLPTDTDRQAVTTGVRGGNDSGAAKLVIS